MRQIRYNLFESMVVFLLSCAILGSTQSTPLAEPDFILVVNTRSASHPKLSFAELRSPDARRTFAEREGYHEYSDEETGAVVLFQESVASLTGLENATVFWQRIRQGQVGPLDFKSYAGQEILRIMEGTMGGTLTANSDQPFLAVGISYYVIGGGMPGGSMIIDRHELPLGEAIFTADAAGRKTAHVFMNPGQLAQQQWHIQTLAGREFWPGIEYSQAIARTSAALAQDQVKRMEAFRQAHQETIARYVGQQFPEMLPHLRGEVSWMSLPQAFRSFIRERALVYRASEFRSEGAWTEWESRNPRVRIRPTLSLGVKTKGEQAAGGTVIVLGIPWEPTPRK